MTLFFAVTNFRAVKNSMHRASMPVPDCQGTRRIKRKEFVPCEVHLYEAGRDGSEVYPRPPPRIKIKRISLIIHLVGAGSRERRKEKRKERKGRGTGDKEKSTIIGRPTVRNTRGLGANRSLFE